MQTVQKAQKRMFTVSLILSVAFVAGIPAIIFGAINKLWVLMALGIVCTVVGFYGMPIAWTTYGEVKSLVRFVSAVTEEHIYTVKELAAQLSMSERKARAKLDKCFQKRYLQGYRREGDKIVLNEGTALEKKQFTAACPNCGAKFSYTGENPRCPYCNLPINSNRK